MIDKVTELNLLYDFYGPVLTERQQRVFTLYYFQDLSLGEIAEELDVSRQAVYDLVHRSERTLRELEGKLGLIRRYREEQNVLAQVKQQLEHVKAALGDHPVSGQVAEALEMLNTLQ